MPHGVRHGGLPHRGRRARPCGLRKVSHRTATRAADGRGRAFELCAPRDQVGRSAAARSSALTNARFAREAGHRVTTGPEPLRDRPKRPLTLLAPMKAIAPAAAPGRGWQCSRCPIAMLEEEFVRAKFSVEACLSGQLVMTRYNADAFGQISGSRTLPYGQCARH